MRTEAVRIEAADTEAVRTVVDRIADRTQVVGEPRFAVAAGSARRPGEVRAAIAEAGPKVAMSDAWLSC